MCMGKLRSEAGDQDGRRSRNLHEWSVLLGRHGEARLTTLGAEKPGLHAYSAVC